MNGAAYHNPENEKAIREKRDKGMKPSPIARELGITRSTVYYYFDKWVREEPIALLDDGPPAVDRPTCFVCGGGNGSHDDCRGKGRGTPAARKGWRRAVA